MLAVLRRATSHGKHAFRSVPLFDPSETLKDSPRTPKDRQFDFRIPIQTMICTIEAAQDPGARAAQGSRRAHPGPMARRAPPELGGVLTVFAQLSQGLGLLHGFARAQGRSQGRAISRPRLGCARELRASF